MYLSLLVHLDLNYDSPTHTTLTHMHIQAVAAVADRR